MAAIGKDLQEVTETLHDLDGSLDELTDATGKADTCSLGPVSAEDGFASTDTSTGKLARRVGELAAASPHHQPTREDEAPSSPLPDDDAAGHSNASISQQVVDAEGAAQASMEERRDCCSTPGETAHVEAGSPLAGVEGGMEEDRKVGMSDAGGRPDEPADMDVPLAGVEAGMQENRKVGVSDAGGRPDEPADMDVDGGLAGTDEPADMDVDAGLAETDNMVGHCEEDAPHAEGFPRDAMAEDEGGSAEPLSGESSSYESLGTGYGPYFTVPVVREQLSEDSVGPKATDEDDEMPTAMSHPDPPVILERLSAGHAERAAPDMTADPEADLGQLGLSGQEVVSDAAAGEGERLGYRTFVVKSPDDIPLPKKAPRAAAKNAANAWASVCPPPKPEAASKPARKEGTQGGEPVFVLPKHSQAAKFADMSGAIAQPWILETAETSRVIWARVKGFPFWPAQVLPDKEAEKRLQSVRMPKDHTLAVMFFGTLEVAWVSPLETCSWKEGTEKGFYQKGQGRKHFQVSVQQVYDFLTPLQKHRRRAPEGWWCKAPAVVCPPDLPPPVDAAGRKSKKRLKGHKELLEKRLRLFENEHCQPSSAAAPGGLGAWGPPGPGTAGPSKGPLGRAPPPLFEVRAADGRSGMPKSAARSRPPPQLFAGPHSGHGDPPLPPGHLLEALNRRPEYDSIRRNVWVATERPRRQSKDDIPVCSCRVPHPPVADLATSASWPQPPPDKTPSFQKTSKFPDGVKLPGNVQEGGQKPAPTSRECRTPTRSMIKGRGPVPSHSAAQPPGASTKSPGENGLCPLLPADGAPHSPDMGHRRFSTGSVPLACSSPGGGGMQIDPEEGLLALLAASSLPPPASPVVPEGTAPAAVSTPNAKPRSLARTGCGENCLNRLSFIHCDPRQCPCGDRCGNRPFHQLEAPRMRVFLTANRGWGVQAAEVIPRGSFIVEYAGEVIDVKECQARMREANESGEPHFYMMELGPGLIIDARRKGNLARLINSSCAPNCETQKWHDAATGEVRIGIFASHDIQPGEELTYDYQFQHSGLAAAALGYRCMCGAPNCRGTMDTHPERFRDFGKRVEIFWEDDGVFYRGTVTGYSVGTRKHTILYDDNDTERVCLEVNTLALNIPAFGISIYGRYPELADIGYAGRASPLAGRGSSAVPYSDSSGESIPALMPLPNLPGAAGRARVPSAGRSRGRVGPGIKTVNKIGGGPVQLPLPPPAYGTLPPPDRINRDMVPARPRKKPDPEEVYDSLQRPDQINQDLVPARPGKKPYPKASRRFGVVRKNPKGKRKVGRGIRQAKAELKARLAMEAQRQQGGGADQGEQLGAFRAEELNTGMSGHLLSPRRGSGRSSGGAQFSPTLCSNALPPLGASPSSNLFMRQRPHKQESPQNMRAGPGVGAFGDAVRYPSPAHPGPLGDGVSIEDMMASPLRQVGRPTSAARAAASGAQALGHLNPPSGAEALGHLTSPSGAQALGHLTSPMPIKAVPSPIEEPPSNTRSEGERKRKTKTPSEKPAKKPRGDQRSRATAAAVPLTSLGAVPIVPQAAGLPNQAALANLLQQRLPNGMTPLQAWAAMVNAQRAAILQRLGPAAVMTLPNAPPGANVVPHPFALHMMDMHWRLAQAQAAAMLPAQVVAMQAAAAQETAQRSPAKKEADAANAVTPPAPQLFVKTNTGPLPPPASNGATSLQQQAAQLQQALASKQMAFAPTGPAIPRSPAPRGNSAGKSTAFGGLSPVLPASLGVLPPPPPLRGIEASPSGMRTPLHSPTVLKGGRPETPNTLRQALMALQESPGSGEESLRGGLGSAGSGGRGGLFPHGLSTPLGLSHSPFTALMNLETEMDGQIGGRSVAGEGICVPPPAAVPGKPCDAGLSAPLPLETSNSPPGNNHSMSALLTHRAGATPPADVSETHSSGPVSMSLPTSSSAGGKGPCYPSPATFFALNLDSKPAPAAEPTFSAAAITGMPASSSLVPDMPLGAVLAMAHSQAQQALAGNGGALPTSSGLDPLHLSCQPSFPAQSLQHSPGEEMLRMLQSEEASYPSDAAPADCEVSKAGQPESASEVQPIADCGVDSGAPELTPTESPRGFPPGHSPAKHSSQGGEVSPSSPVQMAETLAPDSSQAAQLLLENSEGGHASPVPADSAYGGGIRDRAPENGHDESLEGQECRGGSPAAEQAAPSLSGGVGPEGLDGGPQMPDAGNTVSMLEIPRISQEAADGAVIGMPESVPPEQSPGRGQPLTSFAFAGVPHVGPDQEAESPSRAGVLGPCGGTMGQGSGIVEAQIEGKQNLGQGDGCDMQLSKKPAHCDTGLEAGGFGTQMGEVEAGEVVPDIMPGEASAASMEEAAVHAWAGPGPMVATAGDVEGKAGQPILGCSEICSSDVAVAEPQAPLARGPEGEMPMLIAAPSVPSVCR